MKRKSDNRWARIEFSKMCSKQDLLIRKRFPRLFAMCYQYDIPYDFINRCYKRYIKWSKEKNVRIVKDIFEQSIKLYVVAKEEDYEFEFGTRGFEGIYIAKISGFDKYHELYISK